MHVWAILLFMSEDIWGKNKSGSCIVIENVFVFFDFFLIAKSDTCVVDVVKHPEEYQQENPVLVFSDLSLEPSSLVHACSHM